MNEVTFRIVQHGTDEYHECVRLREEILRKPFGLKFLTEELEAEKDHIHIIGKEFDTIVASAVLVPEKGAVFKMQRVVVKETTQSKGIGSQMMTFCEELARSNGFVEIYCHARDTAVNFYLKNGYVAEGDYFLEDTILHLKMTKKL